MALRDSAYVFFHLWPRALTPRPDADNAKLPVGHRREFLLDLISLYYHVALVVVDGYLNQCAQPDAHRLHESASDLLNLAAGKWAGSLHLWPKLFLHTALIAAISLPPEGELLAPPSSTRPSHSRALRPRATASTSRAHRASGLAGWRARQAGQAAVPVTEELCSGAA